MNISTKFHGEREIHEDKIVTFQNGLPGFENENQFVLLELEDTPFVVLQSATTPEVAFIMMNPFEVFPLYEIELSQDVLDELQIETEQDVVLFAILTIREAFEDSTANLQAPMVLNTTKKLGKQYIMKTDQFTTSHAFIEVPVLEKRGGKVMLVLTRKLNESIMIGNDIEITILAVEGEQIKLGINAPKQIDIHRKEIYLAIQQENTEAVKTETNLLTNFSEFLRKK